MNDLLLAFQLQVMRIKSAPVTFTALPEIIPPSSHPGSRRRCTSPEMDAKAMRKVYARRHYLKNQSKRTAYQRRFRAERRGSH